MATDTSAVNNGDAQLEFTSPNSNNSTSALLQVGSQPSPGGILTRDVIKFTMPSTPVGGGTITAITLNLRMWLGAVTKDYSIHELNRSNWVENQVTWNDYSTGNAWTTAGGDYGSALATISLGASTGWKVWSIGTSFTWGDEVSLILKEDSENNGTDSYKLFRSKEFGTPADRPYLEVTYTPGSGFTPTPLMHMRMMAGGVV